MDKNTRNKEKRLFIQIKNSNSLFIERFNELLSSKIDSWNDRDKEYILSCALLFLNYYNQNPCYKNYFRIGYYIILKYSILFKDYKPLYDISLQIGFYPISDYILKHGIIQVDSLSEELINKSISEHYLYNNSYVETFEQYINSREILSNKLSDVVYVAPTSYGKSSLIKDVIKTFRYDKIGIIVPTKSLLTQIYNDIKSTRTLSTFKEIIIDFFRRKNKKQRFVNFSFFALGIILAICVTTFFSLVLIKTDNINYMKNKYIIYDTDNDYAFEFFTNYEDINQYIDEYAGYSYMYVQKYDHDISYNDSFNYYDVIFLPLSDLEDEELISGTKNKMVISTKLVKNMFETTNYNEVIGRKLKLNDYDIIEISGVVTDYTNVLYLDDSIYYDLLFKEDFYSIYKNYDYLNLYDYEYNEVEVIDDYYYEEQFIPIYVLANSDYKVNDILYCNNDENLKLKVIGRINVEGLSDIYDLNIKEVVNNLIFMKDLNKLIALNEMRIENEIFKDLDYVNYKIVEGKLTNNGVLAPINCDYKLGETVYLNNSTVQISGFYEARYAESKNAFLATKENIIFNLVDSKNGIIYFETTNLNAIYDYLNQNYKDEFAVSSVYDYYYNIEKENNEESILIFGIISLILLIIYVLFVYFVMRTRVLNDQYDIAVYRSLGATKKSFYAKYIKEVVVISLFTSTIGYIISFIFYILFNRLAYSVIGLNFFRIDLLSFMIGLLILYVINIIFGLIPIMMYLKKSPAELVSKYDM